MNMYLTSYAQNYEDVMLWRALGHIKNGFYVDVGANDPVEDSVTLAFYERGWSGINIEPINSHFEDLNRERPRDINLRVAISSVKGALRIWDSETRGLATADLGVVTKHEVAGLRGRFIEVPTVLLSDVCATHAHNDIHFLKIDVEGFERQVLEGADFIRFRPWIVVIEATMPNSTKEVYFEWEPILDSAAYKFAYADGLNRFYVAHEHPELIPFLTYPPNVFDAFETHKERRLQVILQKHKDTQAEERRNFEQTSLTLKQNTLKCDELQRQIDEMHHRAIQLQSDLDRSMEFNVSITRELDAVKSELSNAHIQIGLHKAAVERSDSLALASNKAERDSHALAGAHKSATEVALLRVEQLSQSLISTQLLLDSTHRRLDAVYASTSWRLLGPVRRVMRLFFVAWKNDTDHLHLNSPDANVSPAVTTQNKFSQWIFKIFKRIVNYVERQARLRRFFVNSLTNYPRVTNLVRRAVSLPLPSPAASPILVTVHDRTLPIAIRPNTNFVFRRLQKLSNASNQIKK